MGSEEEIADVYEDYLGNENDEHLIVTLHKLKDQIIKQRLEDYEREHLIRIIQNVDWTGKLDTGFEDLRKSISTNDGCG